VRERTYEIHSDNLFAFYYVCELLFSFREASKGDREAKGGKNISPLEGESRSTSCLIVTRIRTKKRALSLALLFSRSTTIPLSRFYLLAASTLSLKLRCIRASGETRAFSYVHKTVRFSIKPSAAAAFHPDYPWRNPHGIPPRGERASENGAITTHSRGRKGVRGRAVQVRGKLNENIGINSSRDFPQRCSFPRWWWIEKPPLCWKLNWPFRTRIPSLFSRMRSVFMYKCIIFL